MSYIITAADLATVSPWEVRYGTDRFLPSLSQIPTEFFDFQENIYSRVAKAMRAGDMPSGINLVMRPGFEDCTRSLNHCVQAHLRSITHADDHIVAGVGYLVSRVCVLTPRGEYGSCSL